MALMASKSNAFIDPHSRLELKTCVEYLWLPTFVVWLLNVCCLLLHYHFNRRKANRTAPKDIPTDIALVEQTHDQEEGSSVVVTQTVEKLPRFTERFRLRHFGGGAEQTPAMPSVMDRSVSVASLASLGQSIGEPAASFEPSKSRLFKTVLFVLLIAVIALLFASSQRVYFDIGMSETSFSHFDLYLT